MSARGFMLARVGIFRALLTGQPDPVTSLALEPDATFAVDADSIDPAVFGLTSYASPLSPSPRLDRKTAIQCGPVKHSRDLIAGTLGTLPFTLMAPDMRPTASPLLEQPERGIAPSVTFTRLFEDLLFEQVAWWRITEADWRGYPAKVKRLHPRSVDVRDDGRVYYRADGTPQGTADAPIPDAELIRFDSPTDGLLICAARSIRIALMVERAVENMADGAPPVDYFTPADGADPADDADVIAILDQWREARRTRSTGYVPAALKYNSAGWSPEQMQLGDMYEKAVLRIAMHAGVDPEELGVSTTSRTYANIFDRRKQFTDFTLGQYFTAVQGRLSMNDVSPRGYAARINLADLLRADPKTRYEGYEVGLRVGALTAQDIAEAEGKAHGLVVPIESENAVTPAAQADDAATFEGDGPELMLDAPQDGPSFAVDVARRTISGLVVPFGVPARSKGQWWQFDAGTLKYSEARRVKLWVRHDPTQAVGVAATLDERPEFEGRPAGLYGVFKVARGAQGDEALSLAEDQVLDGFSVGLKEGGRYKRVGEINHAIEAPVMEVSLTPAPSFDDARVHEVAASADNEGISMTTTDGTATTTEAPSTEAAPAADFSAITDAIASGFASMTRPQETRELVSAGGPLEVTEALPYRFDGLSGAHSFSADLRASASGDSEARQRLDEFMDEAFAVTTTNVTNLNPTANRPELYVPNLEFTRPLWGLVSTGIVNDVTPFTVPKFNAAAGLVGPHTQGTEPTPGSFSATNQTVTPTPVSGKIEINREVWDQGGNPKADAIIWREMLNGYYEALETKIATMLNGLSLTEINLGGAVNQALVTAMSNVLIDLQFVRGGNRYTALGLDAALFKALFNAADGQGRNLLPILSPTNAQGSANGAFSEVALGSQRGVASWALNAGAGTNASNSYLFVPSSVWAWASAPKKFTFEYQVKSIDMAVWGYSAAATIRDTDVKRIDYTTADV